MRKALLFLFIFGLQLAGSYSFAQQLYISTAVVGDGGNMYCNSGGPGIDRSFFNGLTGDHWADSALIEFERPRQGEGGPGTYAYPGNCVAICAKIACVVTSTPSTFGIDELTFEIFKFGNGSNPLDPASTPPIKTISMYNIGTCSCTGDSCANSALQVTNTETGQSWFCANWDANYNLNGTFGKTNGQYGFRARVKTNQVSPTAGNISIEQTSAYPGQNQIPIQVNVTNIHSVRSTPTAVGRITGVAAQPYNILYRLSKDALTSIKIFSANDLVNPVKTVLANAPRVGEGSPDGTLTNGDFWDGRNSSGEMMPPGLYLAQIEAYTNDMWGADLARPATVQIAMDPLQVTDVDIYPLGPSTPDMAAINYMLTEDATVYADIYPPGTQFDNANASPPTIGGSNRCDGESDDLCLRHLSDVKQRRTTVSMYWDGRNSSGSQVCDGDYVYAVYAALPSPAAPGGIIWTARTMIGVMPVARGRVVSSFSPASTVLGSSPSVAGLDPFYFRYTPSHDTAVTMNVRDMNNNIVRHLVVDEMRSGASLKQEAWDGKDDTGLYVSSGNYLAELITNDPFQCAANRSYTATMLFPVNMFRTVDLQTRPLLGGASDMATIGFELSQPMYMDLNIYPPNTIIDPSPWPPTVAATPVYNVQGMRPGRYRITEYWDGRDTSGLLVPDGRYPFTLVARSTAADQEIYSNDESYGYIDVTRGQIFFTSFGVNSTSPVMYNSSDNVRLPPYQIDYSLTRQSSVTVEILTIDLPTRVLRTIVAGGIRNGETDYRDFWDGKDASGNFVPGGPYNVRVRAQDVAARLPFHATAQMTIDTYPLRIYDAAIAPVTVSTAGAISYQVSEPMTVVTKIYKPGTTLDGLTANPLEFISLVKTIINTRPSRTPVSEYWDGTDQQSALVPDGNYVFRVYASTDSETFDLQDGSIINVANLAEDVIIANIPVTNPVPPQSTGVGSIYTTSATVSWTQTITPPLAEVQRSTDNNSFQTVYLGTGTVFADVELEANTTYYYRVRNRNFAGAPTAYGEVVQLLTRDHTPLPPWEFTAESLGGDRIGLSWQPSQTELVRGYKIYFDSGTGIIDYSSPLIELSSSTFGYVTDVLPSSAAYRFALRTVSRYGVEDPNTLTVTAAAYHVTASALRALIKVPQPGKHIKGNRITVVAEVPAEDLARTGQVRFQYKPAQAASWTDIPPATVNTFNPDPDAPYFVHWDVDALGAISAAPYELRAVATDIHADEDPAPAIITVMIDPVNYDINETIVAGSLQKEQKVVNTATNTVQAADEGSSLVTKVVIPPGALNISTVAVAVVNNPPAKPTPPEGFQDLNLSVKVTLSNNQSQLSGGKSAALTFNYKDDNGDGMVDGTTVLVDNLKMYSASTLGDTWTLIPSTVDRANKLVSGLTTHFSFFAVFAGPAANLDTVRVYPVPYLPNDGDTDNGVPYSSSDANSGIIFDNLPSSVKIKIFTLSGQLAADFETSNSLGKLQWDVKNNDGKDVASGGYIAVIASPGHKTVTKKLLIVR